MWYFLYPEDQIHVSNDQCHKELSKLTTDIVKVFNYAQGKAKLDSSRIDMTLYFVWSVCLIVSLAK